MFDPAQTPNPLSQVHRWLVAARSCLPTRNAASLVIEPCGKEIPPLAEGLARHLAEFHDEPDDEWLCLDEALTMLVLRDLPCLRLLEQDEDAALPVHLFLQAITARGRAIIEMPGVLEATQRLDNTFRVALVPMGRHKPRGFHVAIDPLRFDSGCLVAVIGDAFLEWMSNRERLRPANPNPTGRP